MCACILVRNHRTMCVLSKDGSLRIIFYDVVCIILYINEG